MALRSTPRYPLRLAIPLAVVLACGTAGIGVLASEQTRSGAPPTTRPATTQTQDPADTVLDRLLERERPATGGEAARTLSGEDYAGRQDLASGRGPAAVAPNTPPQRLVREGTYVIDRVGRVRHTNDGLEFVFASDGVEPAAAGDPPMVLVPNLSLMAVESALRDDPDRRFRVTGRVTEYRGRNHLMLEKVVVLRS